MPGSNRQVLHFARPGGWHSVTNFGSLAVPLPPGTVILGVSTIDGTHTDIVAVAPSILIAQFHFSQATYRALGGTSVLIVVGVALQTMRQMESQMVMRHYEGFLR